jgi:2-succinyl-5-enolpyruvyl-6-hydroxy-3-cyclohexene-1-carboxylate synthase
MTAPNRNTLWAETLAEELAAGGVRTVCLAPGSRSTPLTVAFARHDDIATYSHLDERSAAFFALGRARQTGRPTPVVCTSGTAAANFHPAVLEASESRVPMVVLTADRPPELRDSGTNQTTDQQQLYGNAVRWYHELPEPEADARKLRSLRVTAARALAESTGTPAGPVHLNAPFKKPLEPTPVEDDVPAAFDENPPLGVEGRRGPFVGVSQGTVDLDDRERQRIVGQLDDAQRGLIVCGPADEPTPSRESLADLVEATGLPVLADPLSGHRFGPHTGDLPICGGYDSYLDGREWPDPDVVLRFGASPTSKVLRTYLASVTASQFVVDPAGGWREAQFTATDLVVADPTAFAEQIGAAGPSPVDSAYRGRFETAERNYWDLVRPECENEFFEGAILQAVASHAPENATLFVSNSMPVRDLDRFGAPRARSLAVHGNRGVSGIDGITSTALGAGSASDEPLVLVTGDLAYYHDMNGLLALGRCDVDATIVLVDNDGGGIFHKLPIEKFDPPFTEQFKTPHGLDFSPTDDIYDLDFQSVEGRDGFIEAFETATTSERTQVLSVSFDAEKSHRFREQLHERVQQHTLSET